MKCPLLVSGNQLAQFCDQTKSGDCLKEKCAWWFASTDHAGNITSRCAVQCMAEGLAIAINAQP